MRRLTPVVPVDYQPLRIHPDAVENWKVAMEEQGKQADVCVASDTGRRCPYCRCGRAVEGETCGELWDHLQRNGGRLG